MSGSPRQGGWHERRVPARLALADADTASGRRARCLRRSRWVCVRCGGARRHPAEHSEAAPRRPACAVGSHHGTADLRGAGGGMARGAEPGVCFRGACCPRGRGGWSRAGPATEGRWCEGASRSALDVGDRDFSLRPAAPEQQADPPGEHGACRCPPQVDVASVGRLAGRDVAPSRQCRRVGIACRSPASVFS